LGYISLTGQVAQATTEKGERIIDWESDMPITSFQVDLGGGASVFPTGQIGGFISQLNSEFVHETDFQKSIVHSMIFAP
jgi:hypothetical protein